MQAEGAEHSDVGDLLELAERAPKRKAPRFGRKGRSESAENDFDDVLNANQYKDPSGDANPNSGDQYLSGQIRPVDNSRPIHPAVHSQLRGALAAASPADIERTFPTPHHPQCQDCGTMLEAGSRFCGECGGQLRVRIPQCSGCGIALEPQAKFCGECGTRRIPDANSVGITEAQFESVPREVLSSSETYRRWMDGMNPNYKQSWMVKLLKFLEA
jgi:hypothetical protein